jgi:hypothetical protein
MITDVLHDARESILRYLEDRMYAEEEFPRIAEVILAMDRLRLSPGYDVPPNATPPVLPDDAMTHLKALLKSRQETSTTPV